MQSLRDVGARVRGWDLWAVRPQLLGYIVAIQAADAVALVAAWTRTVWRPGDLMIFAALLASGGIATEASRSIRAPRGTVVRDLQSIWFIAAAILLPPVYALVAPIPLAAVTVWRVRGAVAYRRVFSAAANGVAYAATSVTFHAVPTAIAGPRPGGGAHALTWTAALAVCGALGLVVNNALLFGAIKLSEPQTRLREMAWNREAIFTDLVQLSYAFAITLSVAINPLLLPATMPIVLVQRRFMMHAQLLAQTRVDAKTGLLNAATWQREAAVELARAVRTRTPLAVAMIDLDHFKSVNDSFGHVAGDRVLRELAHTLQGSLRDYDIVGRFGGEEFMLLLPHTDPTEAAQIADRIRSEVSQQIVTIDDGSVEGYPLQVTVSIGVATLSGSRCDLDLNDLIAAADSALYQAKDAGRNTVRVLADADADLSRGGAREVR